MNLRRKRVASPTTAADAKKNKTVAQKNHHTTSKQRNQNNTPGNDSNPDLENSPSSNNIEKSSNSRPLNNEQNATEFVSCFPALTIDNFENQLDNWKIVELRQALMDQKKNASRHKNQTPNEISTLVEIIRIGYEKRMLMAALMGGVSESMIWSLVNAGPKQKSKMNCFARFLAFCPKALAVNVPARGDSDGWVQHNQTLGDLWQELEPDEKMVFKDPFFFGLAGLPDLSELSQANDGPFEDNDEETITTRNEHPDAQVLAPKIHQLSEAEEQKYRPLFNKLVDVDKVHHNHGKPDKAESTAILERKSLAAFRSAHHEFATVCQRFHIHYHLTAVSCDIDDGWKRAFCTNKTFSEWADKNLKLTKKFKLYVHGKEVAQEIEKKPPQPVDARRGELTRELNRLLGESFVGDTSSCKDFECPH